MLAVLRAGPSQSRRRSQASLADASGFHVQCFSTACYATNHMATESAEVDGNSGLVKILVDGLLDDKDADDEKKQAEA